MLDKPNFPELEEEVLKFWEDNQIFQQSLDKKSPKGDFIFYEGPPTANGRPHIGHVLARAFKDLFPRYKTMQGYHVARKAGWDTHGLPVELEVEKAINISGKKQIEEFGVEKFNKQCKDSVWKYKGEWEKMTKRIGFWIDLEHPYVTYDNEYIESVWWILKQIWDKQLLYKGHKVVPQCPRCGTALSSHEVAQGYKSITEESVYLKFKLVDQKNTYVLAWTTTPWTLPGNVALALGPKVTYVKVKQGNEYYILAKDRLDILESKYEIVEEYKAKDLDGKRYQPLFDFLDLEKVTGKSGYRLALADFVTVEDGTGVVHTAVMYGEDDYNLGEEIGLPKQHTVNDDGTFTDLVKPWAGKFVKDAEAEITQHLKDKGLLYKTEQTTHDYPFCWRCETPLLYYAKDSWFIKMSALRSELIANNKKINWIPEYIKEGRFGEWLNEVKDWAISRERYWGTPLPIWQCTSCHQNECLGSIEELTKKVNKSKIKGQEAKLTKLDLHRPYVDELVWKCDCGGEMRRVSEVIDCWFDSGSMPFAQWHYPFENEDLIDKGKAYPADFIAEAIDQTRGWFYTLLAIGTLLGKGSPYKNVICHGHVMDAKGQKMSKRLGNVISPWEMIDKFGADAIRWFLYTVNQPGEPKNFDPKAVEDVIKKNFLLLWNVLSFYKTYEDEVKSDKLKPKHVLDLWVLAKLDLLVKEVTEELDRYQVAGSARKITAFINQLSTWYLRRSRDRFKGDDQKDKDQAILTLQHCLVTLNKVLAPFAPMISEAFYQELNEEQRSIHLEDWPEPAKKVDEELLTEMETVRLLVEKVLAIRKEAGIKVRQPLASVQVKGKAIKDQLLDLAKDELNVKEVNFVKQLEPGAKWAVKENVALNTEVSDVLAEEGTVREIIRSVNQLRKKQKLTVSDQIKVIYQADSDQLAKLVDNNKEEILKSTISFALEKGTVADDSQEVKVPQGKIRISIQSKQ
ncbi:MAG: isoleucine--tRNA ligase [Patescibacteria group bacterium]